MYRTSAFALTFRWSRRWFGRLRILDFGGLRGHSRHSVLLLDTIRCSSVSKCEHDCREPFLNRSELVSVVGWFDWLFLIPWTESKMSKKEMRKGFIGVPKMPPKMLCQIMPNAHDPWGLYLTFFETRSPKAQTRCYINSTGSGPNNKRSKASFFLWTCSRVKDLKHCRSGIWYIKKHKQTQTLPKRTRNCLGLKCSVLMNNHEAHQNPRKANKISKQQGAS